VEAISVGCPVTHFVILAYLKRLETEQIVHRKSSTSRDKFQLVLSHFLDEADDLCTYTNFETFNRQKARCRGVVVSALTESSI
jgi:hypothetical protein